MALAIGAFARRIVGWCVSRTAHTSFVLDALEQALHDRHPARQGGLIHHSDRGVQYIPIKYTERMAETGIEPSAGSAGDSYGNALAFGVEKARQLAFFGHSGHHAALINGLYKTGVIHRQGQWQSFEAAGFATPEWVDWFNHRRLLEPTANILPAEAEDPCCAMTETPAMAA